MSASTTSQDEYYLFADCIQEQGQIAVAERLEAARRLLNRFTLGRGASGKPEECLTRLTGLTPYDLRLVGLAGMIAWSSFNGDLDLYDQKSIASSCALMSSLDAEELLNMTGGFASKLDLREFMMAAEAVKELSPVISVRAEYQFQTFQSSLRAGEVGA